MADGTTWADQNREIIDKVKGGGYQAAHAHHTKGMLAVHVALEAAYELAVTAAKGDMHSDAARLASKARMFQRKLQAYHLEIDEVAAELLGTPYSLDAGR